MIVRKHTISFLIATSLLLGACSPSEDESGAKENYLGKETTIESNQASESTEIKEEEHSKEDSSNQMEETKEQSDKES